MTRFTLALIVLAIASASGAQVAEGTAEALEEQILELRLDANYADAAEVARDIVALRKGDPDAAPYEIADAERLVGVLEEIAALPPDSQEELAVADSLAAAEEVLWEQGAYADATAAAEHHLAIRQKLLTAPHPDIASSLSALALGFHAQGDLGAAYPLYQQALEMKQELFGNGHPLVAAEMSNVGGLLRSGGDPAGAEEVMREAVTAYRGLYNEPQADFATALGMLAMVLKDRAKYPEAESLSREVLSMQRALFGEGSPELAEGLNNLASVLELLGDYGEAEDLYREALDVSRGALGDEHPQVAAILNNLGQVLKAQGDYAGAEPLLRQSLAMARAILGDGHPYVAMSMTNLGSLLRAQGDDASAETFFLEALAVNRAVMGEQHPEVANSLNNLAMTMYGTGDYVGAESLHREALTMRRALQGDAHPEVAISLENLAAALQAQGDFAAADSLFREALEMSRSLLGDEHPQTANSINNLAALQFERGNFAEAEVGYREAVTAWSQSAGALHPHSLKTSWNLARCLTEQGKYREGEALLSVIADAYDAARVRVGDGLERATFLPAPGSHLAAARLELGDEAGAWPAAERALSRSLADLLMAAGQRRLNERELAREDSLTAAVARLEYEAGAYQRAARGDTTGASQVFASETRTALLTAEARLLQFNREIAERYPVAEGRSYPLGRVQSALSRGTAIVGWIDDASLISPGQSWCYALRSSGPVVWARAGGERAELGELMTSKQIHSLRDLIADPRSPLVALRREASELWRERLAPLESALDNVTELVVLPSGAMVGVPVEVLASDDGVSVGERFAVSYAPSATIHTWLAERIPEGEGIGMLLVGDPPYSADQLAEMQDEMGGTQVAAASIPSAAVLRGVLAGSDEAIAALPRLPGSRGEITAIAALSDETVILLGPDASEAALARFAAAGDLGGYGTIHIATHALVDDERPERSALVLSQVDLPDPLEAAMAGTRIYDGLVTAEEILREWDLNADLVTLSACETGLGKEVMGEGYVGFAYAFLQAGARSLLVSLWKVEDEATSLLMQRFYENRLGKYGDERSGLFREPMTKADALQEAKHWLRSYTDERGGHPYEHPYFWSAFVLIGDGT